MQIVQLDPGDRTAIVGSLNRGDVAVLDLGAPPLARASLTEMFGPVKHHKHSSTAGFVEIRQSSGFTDRTRRPQSTATTQSPHVDGCFLADPPRVVALHCTTPAAIGGASQFVSTETAFATLADRFTPAEIRPLFAPASYTIQRGDTVLTRPVFDLCDGRLSCYFSCHEFNRTFPAITALPAFNYLRDFVGDVASQTTTALEAGYCAVFNNTAVLHGRQGWHDTHHQKRQVERAWFDPPDVKPGAELTTATGRLAAELALHPLPQRTPPGLLRSLQSSSRIQFRTDAVA